VAIEAETEFGEEFVRLWRHEGTLSDAAVADRVRWQLDGWLNGSAVTRPSGGISRVSLMPDELIAAKGRQLGFWGGETEVDERAARVAARLQGQLGADAVRVVERRGGRHFGERLMLVPAATVELRGRTLFDDSEQPPWPGGLPTPSPTRVVAAPRAVEVVDKAGEPVQVDGRGLLSSPPAELRNNRTRAEVAAWAGPWPIDERWWDAETHRRQARFQIVTGDGVARMLTLEGGQWWVTAVWD
jgi:protein ImuB